MIIVIIIAILLIILVAFILVRTFTFGKPLDVVEPLAEEDIDPVSVASHLSQALQFPTISVDEGAPPHPEALTALCKALEKMYPLVHKKLTKVETGAKGLVFYWPGSNPELDPIGMLGHLDVVPVDPNSESDWEYPPFSGKIAEGFVWGRGALDDKNQVIATLEAVEYLLSKGYKPQRGIYLLFGADEELNGAEGASKIVNWLEDHDIRLEAVLDEGYTVVENMLEGVTVPVGMIGIAEKGFLTLVLNVEGKLGHSAMPPRHTAIGTMAEAITRIEQNPLPARLGMITMLMQGIGMALPFMNQMAFSNLWLFRPMILSKTAGSPTINALVRTTTAATMINGGIKANILPAEAKAAVNFRLMPGDTVASVCEHIRKAIDNDKVTFAPAEGSAREASPLSPIDSPAYLALENIIRRSFNSIPVVPALVLAATDSRFYYAVSEQVYRFMPVVLDPGELGRIHGNNERISVDSLAKMVSFYVSLLKAWTGPQE